MPYPGTIFEYIDQSDIPALPTSEPIEPLFMYGITADKGPEDALIVKGQDFYKLYGNDFQSAFEKHGQPLVQAGRTIDAGGKLYVKRVVAPDAVLANLAIVAEVTITETQKVDDQDRPIFITPDGTETIESDGNTPVMIQSGSVKYVGKSTVGKKTLPEISDAIFALMDDAGTEVDDKTVYTYPLFVISDNGRGVSRKKFRIVPDYNTSKNVDFMLHRIEVVENNAITDNALFSMNSNVVYININRSMNKMINTKTSQIRSSYLEEGVNKFVSRMANIVNIDESELIDYDIIYGKTRDGKAIPGFIIDPTGTDLQYIYGIGLVEGGNGAFGTHAYHSNDYETEMAKFYNGTFTDDIYDVDNYKIDLVLDANYPAAVKAAMEDFVTFREDCMYLGDFGTSAKTFDEIHSLSLERMKNKFCSMYHNFYDVIDPYSKKQITVTIMYSMATLIVSHFVNGRNRPLAGYLHNMVIPEAIEGTVNFIPKITPTGNQKELLNDIRVNYAGYYDNLLTIETEYTSQVKHSQFSYINNILAIQEVIKAIRTRCPKTRYSFIDGEDLEKYIEDTQSVIDKFAGNFRTIELTYIGTPEYVANKVFLAAIKVQFRDFVQTEYFKVYALA